MGTSDVAIGSKRAERSGWALTLRMPTLFFLLLLAAVAFAWGFVAQYEPLAQGAMGGVTATGARTIDTMGDPGQLILLDHREGEDFFAAFTIRNEGPLPVEIERLLEPYQLEEPTGEFHPVEVLVHPGEPFVGAKSVPYDVWDEFTPFSLGSGDERRVAVRYEFGECNLAYGERVSVGGYSARFSVFGLDRNTYYELPYTLGIKAAPNGGCG